MSRQRRALTAFGSMAIVLVIASCGVDAGDAVTTPTGNDPAAPTAPTAPNQPAEDLTAEQQQMADTMADAYRDLGFTDEESSCLAEGIAGSIGAGETTPDLTGMMDVVNQCDIPVDRLMEIQGGMGDGTTEGALKESLETGFKASGMSDEEASCVADGFISEYGVDVEAMLDADKLVPIAEDCGVDPSKLPAGN